MMQHSIYRASLRFCLALFQLVVAVDVSAQVVTTGAITGTVTDATGANVPDATVTITNQGTGSSHTVTSGSSGFYSAESLTVGLYTVMVSKEGFEQNLVKDIQLDASMRRAVDVRLKVGSASAQVTVTADSVQVNSD